MMRYELLMQGEQYLPSRTDVWQGVGERYINLGLFKKVWFVNIPNVCQAAFHRVSRWIAGICGGDAA